ncbi:PhzF family phenazine biosynthesis protein [Cellulomonas endophytica]|uniref:PhzF family phenazine biosynthesis protein n=1 Tax=Cellulomonas endophytica TaxID=2494735 RepID=UPI001F0C30E9|nr:PhzF family phenazine biosynthesis protein [Cellulomonas endophytica]
MTRPRPFAQVDVFTSTALLGNPVAVVLDAADLDDASMAAFARWTNLSETTFVLPPTAPRADYRLRIFTPGGELPFAGHPTLGSAHAWLEAGGVPRDGDAVVQECAAGLVPLRRDGDGLAFLAPPLLRDGPLDEPLVTRVAAALGLGRDEVLDHRWADNGPGWAAVLLASADAVLALRPDPALVGDLRIGVVGPLPPGGHAAVEVRAFCPSLGVPEDPVTGSLDAGLAPWLVATGVVPPVYVASQGAAVGRRGAVRVRVEDGVVHVGGTSTTCIRGTVVL